METDLEAFIRAGWSRHEAETQAVADELAAACASIGRADQMAPFAGLLTHVYGVHLAQWAQGAALLESLRRAPAYDGTPATEGPIARGIAVLGLAGGDDGAADALGAEDRITARAQACAALLDRRQLDRATALLDAALQEARHTALADTSPAVRSLAVSGNNLAATLEELAERTPAQAEAMVRAAEAALDHWQRCGGWLEQERATYRLARSLLCAGQAGDALAAARRCVRICEANSAPAFEQFFGHAAAAMALRAVGNDAGFVQARDRALRLHAQVPDDKRRWCADDLAEIQNPAADPP